MPRRWLYPPARPRADARHHHTIQEWEQRQLQYILGARLRRQREGRRAVLGRAGRYHEVADNLRVKEVLVEGRRYIVCHNPEEAAKDVADREAIVHALGRISSGRGRSGWWAPASSGGSGGSPGGL